MKSDRHRVKAPYPSSLSLSFSSSSPPMYTSADGRAEHPLWGSRSSARAAKERKVAYRCGSKQRGEEALPPSKEFFFFTFRERHLT